jgi:hypothetical protein
VSDISSTLAKLANKIDDEGGRLSLMATPPSQPAEDRWVAGLEWGEEEVGSSMYAGAAYGTGSTIQEALAALTQDLSL